jgi:hypothetical protein
MEIGYRFESRRWEVESFSLVVSNFSVKLELRWSAE